MLDIEKYLESLDLERGALHGVEYTAKCPFHSPDNSPSFSMSIDTGQWQCWADRCGLRGGIIRFIYLYEKIPWEEAKRKAQIIDLPQSSLEVEKLMDRETKPEVEKFAEFKEMAFVEDLDNKALHHFKSNFSLEDAEPFGVKKLIGGIFRGGLYVPFRKFTGEQVSFQIRVKAGNLKWWNPPDCPNRIMLYGADQLYGKRVKTLFAVEGVFDVIGLSKWGRHGLGIQGTTMTDEQVIQLVGIYLDVGAELLSIFIDRGTLQSTQDRILGELASVGIKSQLLDYDRVGLKADDPAELDEEDVSRLEAVGL